MTDWDESNYCMNKHSCKNYVPNTGCDSCQSSVFLCSYYEDNGVEINYTGYFILNYQEEGDR